MLNYLAKHSLRRQRQERELSRNRMMYRTLFGKGGLVQCRRCGAYYPRFTTYIQETDKGWYCRWCIDPQD